MGIEAKKGFRREKFEFFNIVAPRSNDEPDGEFWCSLRVILHISLWVAVLVTEIYTWVQFDKDKHALPLLYDRTSSINGTIPNDLPRVYTYAFIESSFVSYMIAFGVLFIFLVLLILGQSPAFTNSPLINIINGSITISAVAGLAASLLLALNDNHEIAYFRLVMSGSLLKLLISQVLQRNDMINANLRYTPGTDYLSVTTAKSGP